MQGLFKGNHGYKGPWTVPTVGLRRLIRKLELPSYAHLCKIGRFFLIAAGLVTDSHAREYVTQK